MFIPSQRFFLFYLCRVICGILWLAKAASADTDIVSLKSAQEAVNNHDVVTITVDRSKPVGVSHFETGVTHTQYSLDAWGDAASIARSKQLLQAACRYQNQHIMGWGADNPERAPGVYNWASLDARINLIRSMHATPVITLCGAPDWMKGGTPGKTDWSKLEVAPLPAHYDDFAALARQVAQRYPDVKYFQVWNEMKGLWKPAINNWDYVAYTALYNKVYDALKSVNRDIKVGGPYLVIEGTGSKRGDWSTAAPITPRQWDVLNYWLQHKHGADFITLDRGLKDFHDKSLYTDAEAMALTHFFGDVARQIKDKTNLPLWWAEYYGWHNGDRDFVAANYASIMQHMVRADTAVALLWQPQDAGNELQEALFSDTRHPGGGQPFPFYPVFKAFHDSFGPGTLLYPAVVSSPDVEVLASAHKIMLINKHNGQVQVSLNGQLITLKRYEVRVVDG
ncbi:MAG: hypothetical protein JO316_06335 [Abitibacteriaceae bacterium]|nr:hypothetical protein [Abditibacteriaceae bacterium]